MKVDGRTAVITGAASGMGRSLAVKLARGGAHVALCDVDATGLAETKRLAEAAARRPGLQVSTHRVDVSDREAVKQFAAEVCAAHGGKVHLLFANAGITAPGALIHGPDATPEDIDTHERNFDRCFDIDYFGVLHTVRAFLPTLIAQDEAYVLLTASVNGFWTWPEHACYSTAKYAVRGLADSLLVETYVKAPHVHVASIMPGGVRTGIVTNSLYKGDTNSTNTHFSGIADLDSDEAADWILDGVAKNRTRILVGYDAVMLDILSRFGGPHRAFGVWKALGREGVTSFDPAKLDTVIKQVRAISPLGWLRFLVNGGGHFLFFMSPFLVLRLRRSPAIKAVAALLSALVMRRILRSRV